MAYEQAIHLPAMQEMLDFEDLAVLRLCSKELYSEKWILDRLDVTKFPDDVERKYHPWKYLSWQTMMYQKRKVCQVCGEKTDKSHLAVKESVYGHVQCVLGKVIEKNFPKPMDQKLMYEITKTYYYLPNEAKLQKKLRIFAGVRKWLYADRNKALQEEEESILRLCLEERCFVENTVKIKLFCQALGLEDRCKYSLNVDDKQLKNNFAQYTQTCKNELERRKRCVQLELDVLYLPCNVNFSSKRYAWEDILQRELLRFETNFNPWSVAQAIGEYYVYERTGIEVDGVDPSMWLSHEDYIYTLMCKWRGVARAIGRLIVLRKEVAPWNRPRKRQRKLDEFFV